MLFQTTQAHEELRAKVRAFAEEEIKPIAFMLDQQNEFPDEADPGSWARLGLDGHPLPRRSTAVPGWTTLSYAIAVEELARVDGGAGRHPVRPCVPGLLAHLRLRHRGAEAEIPGAPGHRARRSAPSA